MRTGRVLAGVVALATALAVLVCGSAAGLVVTETRVKEDAIFEGAGCGSVSSVSVFVPRRARRVRAVSPLEGAALRDVDTRARVARVKVRKGRSGGKRVVRFVATGSDDACANPARYGDVGWVAYEDSVSIRYRVPRRVYFRSYVRGSYLKTRYHPDRIRFGERTFIRRIRWSRWNGRVAKGRGTLKDRGKPYGVSIHLSRPQRCGHRYHYLRLALRYPRSKPRGVSRTYSEQHTCP